MGMISRQTVLPRRLGFSTLITLFQSVEMLVLDTRHIDTDGAQVEDRFGGHRTTLPAWSRCFV